MSIDLPDPDPEPLIAAIQAAQAAIDSLQGKTVTIDVSNPN
jgi:hypothetical protein